MKKKIQVSILLTIILLFAFILIWGKIIPIRSYEENSIEIMLKEVTEITTNSKVGMPGYTASYTLIYSGESNKYFLLTYFKKNRFKYFYPHIEEQKTELTILVNEGDLNNPDLGSKSRPIPVMNYKIDGEFVFDEEQYHKNIREYQAYCRWPWVKW